MKKINWKHFSIVTIIVFIWINIGEVARALFVAFPKIETFFEGSGLTIGTMDFSHALVWGLWDLILTLVLVFIFWLCKEVFGNNHKSILISSIITAFATIGIFWIATINTGLGEWSSFFIIFPIAWVEFYIGGWIASSLYAKYDKKN
ncbi:MAG: hypothetical protein WC140_06440 [Bacteroidales bacterium]